MCALLIVLLAYTQSSPTLAGADIRYVATDGVCGGKSPCYTTIQAAVDAAQVGDEILIATGTYTGDGEAVVEIAKSLTLRGGYTATFDVHDLMRYPTQIDAEKERRGIYICDPESHVLTLDVVLEGLHVIGSRPSDVTAPYERGGGIYVERAAQVTLQDNHIYDNEDSGVLAWSVNDLYLLHNRVYGNTAPSFGGGMEIHARSITIQSNEVYSNSVDAGGSGLYISGSGMMRENHVWRNAGSSAVVLHNSDIQLINNFIVDNMDGGVTVIGGAAHLLHNTLASNGMCGVAVTNSGQMAGTAYLTNTILVSHTVGVQTNWITVDNSTYLLATLWGNVTDTTGSGTIETVRDITGDAAFVDPHANNYHITAASAARNRGVPIQVLTDIDGEMRDPLPDLGADEIHVPGSIHQLHLPLILRSP